MKAAGLKWDEATPLPLPQRPHEDGARHEDDGRTDRQSTGPRQRDRLPQDTADARVTDIAPMFGALRLPRSILFGRGQRAALGSATARIGGAR